MKSTSTFPGFVFLAVVGLGSVAAYFVNKMHSSFAAIMVLLFSVIVAALVFSSIRVADQWTRGVVLRLGKFRGLEGPGVFLIVPFFDSVPYWMDTRVLTSALKVEKTPTRDGVPVDVDAVLFWRIVDPKRAALEVMDYHGAIRSVFQAVLHETVGTATLRELLEECGEMSDVAQTMIEGRSRAWGIEVISVEVRDVVIPEALRDAMSTQAERETRTDVAGVAAFPVELANRVTPVAVAPEGDAEPLAKKDLQQSVRPLLTKANIIRSTGSSS